MKINPNEIKKELSRRRLIDFIQYTFPAYETNWHHKFIADKLTDFALGKIKNIILSVPPQFGKSEIASRRLPAFCFGVNPDLKIVGCSYNETFASKFNRQIQRIIDCKEYRDIFSKTSLNSKNVATDSKGNYLRNSTEFEIVGRSGSYMSVGVGGGITGNRVDIGIIDDPIKGREEANSPRYREKLWEWYTDEFRTRLHNSSQQLIIMTRWHEDDIIGRILASEPEKWEYINIPAILEEKIEYDPREVGDTLWESRHSKEKILGIKELNRNTFESLYQGNPTTPDGNKIKEHYFNIIEPQQVPQNITWNMFIDGAYTKKTENDPTGLFTYAYIEHENRIIIKNSIDKYLELPELLKYIKTYADMQGIDAKSAIYIEPKASGMSTRQFLNKIGFNAIDISHEYINKSKIERVEAVLPILESGKVDIVKGHWNSGFKHQLKAFPNGAHDEHVDNLCYCLIKEFLLKKKKKKKNYSDYSI